MSRSKKHATYTVKPWIDNALDEVRETTDLNKSQAVNMALEMYLRENHTQIASKHYEE